jgi:predicted amidophosphoribosyltransferase
MYFDTKSYLKNNRNRNHTTKQALKKNAMQDNHVLLIDIK